MKRATMITREIWKSKKTWVKIPMARRMKKKRARRMTNRERKDSDMRRSSLSSRWALSQTRRSSRQPKWLQRSLSNKTSRCSSNFMRSMMTRKMRMIRNPTIARVRSRQGLS